MLFRFSQRATAQFFYCDITAEFSNVIGQGVVDLFSRTATLTSWNSKSQVYINTIGLIYYRFYSNRPFSGTRIADDPHNLQLFKR